MNVARIILRTILVASFAMWFGGFGFYVSFVVPIGNEVLGSNFEQGLITRRATIPLNYLGVIAVFTMLIESAATWRNNRKPILKKVQFSMVLIMSVMLIALFWLHPQIDAFVDRDIHEISGDYDQFYWLHRLYLWASTIQWIAAWVWLYCFCSSVYPGSRAVQSEPGI